MQPCHKLELPPHANLPTQSSQFRVDIHVCLDSYNTACWVTNRERGHMVPQQSHEAADVENTELYRDYVSQASFKESYNWFLEKHEYKSNCV